MRRVLPIDRPVALFDLARTRDLEREAVASLPPHTLMRRAGEATARLALAIAPHARQFWIAAGPGNNGGDGLDAAIHLLRWGKQVDLSMLGDPAALPADAQDAFARAQAAGVRIHPGATRPPQAPQMAIDALLGAGTSRAPRGEIADCIRQLNGLECPVLAIDLPSGLDAGTGQPFGDACVVAAHTLAMLTLKPGLFTGAGRDHAGTVWLATLGVEGPEDAAQAWLTGVTPDTVLAPRRHAQHKGSFGDVAVVGGAPGMLGAGVLAARAAHVGGAGRVFLELLDRTDRAPNIDAWRPELMLRADWSHSAPEVLARSTVVCGCGGGDAVRPVLPRLLSLSARLVLDADALNAIASDPSLAGQLRARAARGLATVLTPHPLEAARLLAVTSAEIQSDRLRAAHALVERFDCVVVLKGSGTIIAASNQTARINSTGNASLASAGTGDVLAGWLGGRWARAGSANAAATAFSVAQRAVAEHGAAAEPAPADALLASDLIDRLSQRR